MGAGKDYRDKVDAFCEAQLQRMIHKIIKYKIADMDFRKNERGLKDMPPAVLSAMRPADLDKQKKGIEELRKKMEKAKEEMDHMLELCGFEKSTPGGEYVVSKEIDELLKKEGMLDDWETDQHWDEKNSNNLWKTELENTDKRWEKAHEELNEARKNYLKELKEKGLDEKESEDRIQEDRKIRESNFWKQPSRHQRFREYCPKVGKGAWECGAICKTIPGHSCTRHTYDVYCWQHVA